MIDGRVTDSWNTQMAGTDPFVMRVYVSAVDWAPFWLPTMCSVSAASYASAGVSAGVTAVAYDFNNLLHLPIYNSCVWSYVKAFYTYIFQTQALRSNSRLLFTYTPAAFAWADYDSSLIVKVANVLTEIDYKAWVALMISDLASIFGDYKYKLVFAGEDYPYGPSFWNIQLLAQSAVAAGFGIRSTNTESFNDHLNQLPSYGMSIQSDGTVAVNPAHSFRSYYDKRFVAAQNECFSTSSSLTCTLSTVSTQVEFAVRTAAFKTLQMGATHVFVDPGTVTTQGSYLTAYAPLYNFVRSSLGRKAEDSSDAWVVLREAKDSYWDQVFSATTTSTVTWTNTPWVKHISRYLTLVEGTGSVTAKGTEIHTTNYDIGTTTNAVSYEGRKTQLSSSNSKIQFAVDTTWGLKTATLASADKIISTVSFKVTVLDATAGATMALYTKSSANADQFQSYVMLNDNKVKTITFAFTNVIFNGGYSNSADFELRATGGDIEVRMVRILKGVASATVPTSLTAVSGPVPSTQVILSWLPGAPNNCVFSSWLVSSGSISGCLATALTSRTVTTCTATGLSSNTLLSFTVQEMCTTATNAFKSPTTVAVTFTTAGLPAGAPTISSAAFLSTVSNFIVLSWAPGSSNGCTFSAWSVKATDVSASNTVSTPAGCDNSGSVILRNSPTCTATGLIAGRGYFFTITETCSDFRTNSVASTQSVTLTSVPLATSCVYSPSSYIVVMDLVMAASAPSLCTNTPTLYSITGIFPVGLNFNPNTGAVTGTPTSKTSTYNVQTVTPFNQGGAGSTFTFSVLVNPQLPSGCHYGASGALPYLNFTQGSSSLFPVSDCVLAYTPTSFAISATPALPSGITFSTINGLLTGIPVASTTSYATYTITPANQAGPGTSFLAYILVNPPLPSGCVYPVTPDPVSLIPASQVVTGASLTSFAPSSCLNGPTKFNIVPAIAGGLTFDTTSGSFSGTSTQASLLVVIYTVYPVNQNGVGTPFNVQITYYPQPPYGCEYPKNSYVNVTTTETIASPSPYTPINCVNAPTSFALSPTLAEVGLAFNTVTGAITGTPATQTYSYNKYTVTPSNAKDFGTSFFVYILVNPLVPTGCTYNPLSKELIVNVAMVPLIPINCMPYTNLFSLVGQLPVGLSFDSYSGTVSGTPILVTTTLAVYTMIPYDQGGAGTPLTLSLRVNPQTVTGCSYTSPLAVIAGLLMTDLFPANCVNSPTSFTTDLTQFPAGLVFDTTSGSITGTPTTFSTIPVTLYATPFNQGGQGARFSVVLTSSPQPPLGCYYPAVLTTPTDRYIFVTESSLVVATPVCPNFPASSYARSGLTLPTGLLFSSVLGIISGTPTLQTGAVALVLTVTPSNLGGLGTSFTITFEVKLRAPTPTSVTAVAGVPVVTALAVSWTAGVTPAIQITAGGQGCVFSSWLVTIATGYPGAGTIPSGCTSVYLKSRSVVSCNAYDLSVASSYAFTVQEICTDATLNGVVAQSNQFTTSSIIPGICNSVDCGTFGQCDSGSGLCVCASGFSGSDPYHCDNAPCTSISCTTGSSPVCTVTPAQIPAATCYPTNTNYLGPMLDCTYLDNGQMSCTPIASTAFPV